MARKSKARGPKRVTKDLAPRRQAKGGKGEITGLEPQAARSRHSGGVNVVMGDGSVRN
jgi:prepilin-type processing-associated H-X9-DG protein